MKKILVIIAMMTAPAIADEYKGQLTINPMIHNAISPLQPLAPYSGAKVYNSRGEFGGNLNSNRYDPDSVSNPYGRYGSRFSPDSMNNKYGAGSRFKSDSPNNIYSDGWEVWE